MGKTSSRSDGKSHADRKFDKKMQFYELVRGAVAKKAISKEKQQRRRQKKVKAYDLSTLSEFLPDLNALEKSRPADLKINSKSRKNIVLKECNQMKTVINHPVFQSDPLAAIYQHLLNTQPATDEKLKKRDSKTRKSKVKKKKSKAVESMEI